MERYLIGGVVAIAFIAFIVLLVMADKKANKKFAAKIAAEHHMKDQYGKFIVTEEGEFMFSLPSGSLEGYKLWKLSDIGAIAVHNNQFTIMDPSQKASKGEYLSPSKKPLKEKSYKTFDVQRGQSAEEVADLIIRNAEHVKLIQKGKVQ
ncbi:MAG: hypothetical protein J5636_03895 [Clostridiales bacterium]|nr:hypothetical protein [Clostridiales bacterium]